MFQLDLRSRKSIYQQIIDNIKELILNGVLEIDEQLPSVRTFSKMLTVNPNTLQKAYRELERQGYIYTVAGIGAFVSKPDQAIVDEKFLQETKDHLFNDIKELLLMGLSEKEIKEMVESLLRKEASNDKSAELK